METNSDVINEFVSFLKTIGVKDFSKYEGLFEFVLRLSKNGWDFYKMDPEELAYLNKEFNEQFSIIYGFATYHYKH